MSKHQYSPIWDKVVRKSGLNNYGNTLSPIINYRYVQYARECGSSTDFENWMRCEMPPEIVRSALSPNIASSISETIDSRINIQEKHSAQSAFFSMKNPLSLYNNLIIDLFSGPLDKAIRKIIGSYYRIDWFDCYRVYPPKVDKSWMWHIDNSPPCHLKVLLYLTECDIETGATIYLNPNETRIVKKAGYYGVRSDERVSNVDDLCAGSIRLTEMSLHAKPGDALIINTNLLHRGGPIRNHRDVMSFFILPSAMPWQESLHHQGIESLELAGGFPNMPVRYPIHKD